MCYVLPFTGNLHFRRASLAAAMLPPWLPTLMVETQASGRWMATSQPETLPLPEMLSVAPELKVTLSPIGRQRRRALGWVPRERETAMPGRCSKGTRPDS